MLQRTRAPISPPHIITLVLAGACNAIAMNMFLPSLPAMARYFDTDYSTVQMAVSLYLAATAAIQLFIGPASDRFGRRPVLLACFVVFLAGTLAAPFASSIELLLTCRVLQAFSAAGMVLSRAIVRDLVETDEAASKIGYITMAMAMGPMVGPVIGGLLDEIYGWQSTFWLTFSFGLIAFVAIWFDLGETNLRKSASMAAQFRTYPELFGSRRFWGYTLVAAFTSGTFFAFLGGGPYVASEILGLSPSQYGLGFAIVSFGYMSGNFVSGRFSRRVGINRMILSGNLVAFLGIVPALIFLQFGYHDVVLLFGAAAFVGFGNGMGLPNSMAGVVSVRPNLAGSAAGLGGCLQLGGGAALSLAAGMMLGAGSGPGPMLWIMFGSTGVASLMALWLMRIARIKGRL